MCRLAYLHFGKDVSQKRREKLVRRVLKNSWELGNRHGCGVVSFTAGSTDAPVCARALQLDQLVLPTPLGSDILVHARFSTNTISLANTHPFAIADAYLVHNGVVHLEERTDLVAKASTNNDSELILKAYLASGRKFGDALDILSGMANVALWDARRGILTLFGHTGRLLVWRQRGAVIVVQERAQAKGVISVGFGQPFESATIPRGRIVELALGRSTTERSSAWVRAFAQAVAHAESVVEQTLGSEDMGSEDDSTDRPSCGAHPATEGKPSYPSTYVAVKSSYPPPRYVTPSIAQLPSGHWRVNGRTYTSLGQPVYEIDGRPAPWERVGHSTRKRDRKQLRVALAKDAEKRERHEKDSTGVV